MLHRSRSVAQGCTEKPTQLSKKMGRPHWYSGQIHGPPVLEESVYGGVKCFGFTYSVY
jgi:hypothetical protein